MPGVMVNAWGEVALATKCLGTVVGSRRLKQVVRDWATGRATEAIARSW